MKSTTSRNDYLLNLASANAHLDRYYTSELPELIKVGTLLFVKHWRIMYIINYWDSCTCGMVSFHNIPLNQDSLWGTKDSWLHVDVPWMPWLKNYIMAYRRLSTHFGSKTFTPPPWVWGNHNLRPGCRRGLLGHFTPPLGSTLTAWRTCTFPESTVPKMAINWGEVN